jgi:hypothetical protein
VSTTVVCTECGAVATAGNTFCTTCGRYLEWDGKSEPADGVATAAVPPPTVPIPIVVPPRVIEGGTPCPACAASNPEGRRFCLQCGARLVAAPPATPPPAPKSARPTRRLPAIVSAVVGIAVVGAFAGVLTRGGGDKAPDGAPSSSVASTTVVATTALPAPSVVDPRTITAIASSVLPPDGAFTYGINNTLDKNLETAWNDGAAGTGAGEKLTYRFDRPLQLVTVRIVNGYASTPELFKENARIRAAVLVTDSGRFPVTLPDVADRQEITVEFGRTASLVIEVVSVYPGMKYEDLAVTEVEFLSRP